MRAVTAKAATDPRPLLTVTEASVRLAVSLRTTRALIAEGRLPVIRISRGCVRVHPADLDRFIAEARDDR